MIKFPRNINFNSANKLLKKIKIKINYNDLVDKNNADFIFRKKPVPIFLEQFFLLYKLITLNKRTTILEFGSGYSTLAFKIAMSENKKKYSHFFYRKKMRRNNCFEVHVMENLKIYRENTKRLIKYKINKNYNEAKVVFYKWQPQMTLFNSYICTEYKKIPLVNPDFIYLDGPSQFSVKNRVNNFTTAHKDIPAVGCDILKIEHFLLPGTIIAIDGRVANVRFLKNNFKRNWSYKEHKLTDMHLFYLNEPPLGIWNKRLMDFYKTDL